MTRTLTSRIAALTVAAVALAGCSTTPARENRPTIVPAQPAVAPESTAPPAGAVTPAGAGEGLAFDPKGRRLAAITDGAVVLYAVDGGLREVGKVATEGRANQVVANSGGGFLVAVKNRVLTVAKDGAEPAGAPFGIDSGEILSVAPYSAGHGEYALVGTSDGRIVSFAASSKPKTITGPVEASRVLVHGADVVVVDRLQASVAEVDVAAGKLGKGLRVGRGITNAAVDPYGRLFAVDTGKNQVIGYTMAPLMEKFLYPEPGSPWAVGYDETDKLMWVTRTATNEVVGYSLNTGIPEQRKLFPTVRQPNAIAVDAKAGTVYVQSATGAGIQAIPTR